MNQLFGKSFDHWAEVDEAMRRFDIKTAAQLRERLGKPKDPKADWVPIYDKVNKHRLLGFYMQRPIVKGGRSYLVEALTVPFSPYDSIITNPAFDFQVNRVELEFDWRQDPANYTAQMVFITESPLKTLLRIEHFALPGESREQVRERLMMQRYT